MATVNCVRYSGQSGGGMARVADYLEQEKKTLDENSRRLISGQNCSAQFAVREFTATREMHHKKSPGWFYHYTQSFHPDKNVTGPQAHEIAKEFAAKAWPDSEVLIATHIDADHIHSHFLVNAVCYETGKMLRQGSNTLQHLRQLSDELCVVYGLSVLPPNQETRHGMSAREYRSAAKGQSWKFQLINAVDDCMKRSRTKEEFTRNMKQLNAQQSEATQPSEQIPQPPVQQQPLQPILIQCAMPEVLTQLEKQLHHLEEQSEWQTEYLYKLFETRNSHPTREQIAQLQKSLTQIETMLEQAGKQNEKRFSLPSIKLPRLRLPHLSPAMLLIPTLLVVLWAAWYSLGALWNAPRILSQ